MTTPNYATLTKLEQTTDGGYCYIAYHPELPTVISQGATAQEARANLVEATELALEHLAAHGLPIPTPTDVFSQTSTTAMQQARRWLQENPTALVTIQADGTLIIQTQQGRIVISGATDLRVE